MENATDIISWILLMAGSLFAVVGGIGLLRLPTFFTRIHAAGMAETMCAPPILMAMMIHSGWDLTTFKLVAILFFLLITSPTASHALAKAALHGGIDPQAHPGGHR